MRIETRQSIVLVAGTGVTAVLGLAYSLYVTRVLGPAKVADFMAAIALVALCQIAFGPISAAVTRFTAQYAADGAFGRIRTLNREINRRVTRYALIGFVVGLLLLKPLAALLHFRSFVELLMAYVIIYLLVVLGIARGVIRGSQRYGQLNGNTIVEGVVRLGVGILVLSFFREPWAGLSAYLIATVCVLGMARVQLRGVWAGYKPERVDEHTIKRFTGAMFLVMMISAGFQNIDMLFAKHYFQEAHAGLYGAAFILAGRSVSALVTPFATMMLPLVTTLHEQGKAVLGPLFRVCGYFLCLSAIPVVLFFFWPDAIIVALYGEEFADAASPLFTLALARVVGYLCHLIVLACAAMSDFRTLRVYVPAFALQVVLLLFRHETAEEVATVLLLGQAVTLGALIVHLIVSTQRRWATVMA